MRRISLKDRLRYRFDNVMSRGILALLGMVGLATLVLVVAGAVVMLLTGFRRDEEEPRSMLENFWLAAMRTLDSGTSAAIRAGASASSPSSSRWAASSSSARL